MRSVRFGIAFTAVGVLLCLVLLLNAAWYSFVAFMLVAQPLLLVGFVVFVGAVVAELRRKDVL